MADKCVVRNEAYTREKVGNMERHNERKNERYGNGDVQLDRSALNVHFKECEGGYLQAFDKLIEDRTISTRGLQADANIIDEMVFDVNTEYFERHGGYEYAKSFYEEAYRMAVKEAGGEQYILSAVMHADERNKALSEQLGRDVYHYHLHVMYIPVVDKEVLWSKRCKDPALVGTVKEVIKQISNSKKWKSEKVMGENGKERLVYSYSLLQDRYFEHMQAAGFKDFERGERGSTAEHLDVLEYKNKQETERAAALAVVVEQKQEAADVLDQKTEKKQKQLDGLEKKTAVAKEEAATFAEIEAMPKKTLGGNIQLSPADWKTVSGLAKEGVKSRLIIKEMKAKISELLRKITGLEKKLEQYQGMGVTDTLRYYEAMQRAPRRLAETVADIKRQPPEKQERTAPERRRSTGLEV